MLDILENTDLSISFAGNLRLSSAHVLFDTSLWRYVSGIYLPNWLLRTSPQASQYLLFCVYLHYQTSKVNVAVGLHFY